MGLKLALKPTFTTKVEVDIANDKGGMDRQVFFITFERADVEKAAELAALPLNADVIRSQIRGWRDILTDDGQQLPFTAENLDAFLSLPPVILPTARAFWAGNNGAKQGN